MYTKPRTSKVQQFGQPGQDESETPGAGNAMSHARTIVRKSAGARKRRTKSRRGKEPTVGRPGEEEEATTDSDEGRENDGGTQTEDRSENAENKKRDDKVQKKRKQVLYRLRVYMKSPCKSELHQRPGR
ncbi:hypothetical protein PG991_001596 [Apiospora marii]|uniref:Uncharacterized protein n=1 Tax=Apiospora marii TaxID=335849 RepID=A0ABR1SQ51_9PEZI